MRIVLYLMCVVFICSEAIAQQYGIIKSDTTRSIKNQGELENVWAKNLFEQEYVRHYFERYRDTIFKIDDYTFNFGSNIIRVYNTSATFKKLLSLGVLFPSIIEGDDEKNDTLNIDHIEELSFLNTSSTVKRCRFLLFWKGSGIPNPFVCLFELTNERATKKTDLSTFIIGANLTFFKRGWVMN